MSSRKKRRKAVRKEEVIRVLATDEQKDTLTDAAEKAGHSLSSYLLSAGLRQAALDGAAP